MDHAMDYMVAIQPNMYKLFALKPVQFQPVLGNMSGFALKITNHEKA